MAKLSGVADVRNTIRGTSSYDIITGGNLADRIYGNLEVDYITGGAGNDYIVGGEGHDQMFGGAGNDTLVGGTDDFDQYTINTGEGNDTVIDRGGYGDYLYANFLTNATSGVFIKKGNDLIIAEGTVDNLSVEIANVQGLATLAARRAGMRTIVSNLSNSVTIKNHFNGKGGEVERIYATGSATVYDQTIATNLVDYSTGLKVLNQAVTNADIVKGTGVVDHIIASKNGQILKGGKSGDTYYIDAKTDVIIEDTGSSYNNSDQILFDDNNGGANVFTYTKEGNNLKVEFDDGSGAVVASAIVKNYYLRNGYQIEYIGSDDDGDISAGVVYDSRGTDDIRDNVAALTSTTRVLRGTITDDRLDVAATGQVVYGLAGDDEYTVTAGQSVIVDSGGSDRFNADYIATHNDGIYIKRGNDLILLDGSDDPDGVGGYADADAAIADLPNLTTVSQRRSVLNTLMEMNDSVIIKNYFTAEGTVYLRALNDVNISSISFSSEIVDYRTGLKYFNQDANTKIVRGTDLSDEIIVTASNQKIYGKKGTDLYTIAGGYTDVEIYNSGGAGTIMFSQADLDGADSLSYQKIGNDLKLNVTDAGDGDSSVIIKNYFRNDDNKINVVYDQDFGYFSWAFDLIDSSGKFMGGSGNDSVYATYGDDTINGGSAWANDYLYGYEGSDTYEFRSQDQNDEIHEVDATADDTDRAVFLDADFSLASSSITLTREGNDLRISVDEGDGTLTNCVVDNYYAGGTSQIEVIEDGYGNSYDLTTFVVSANFNAAITFTSDGNGDIFTLPDTDTLFQGNGGVDVLIGNTGNDTVEGGDGNDILTTGDGDDYIDGGDGNDSFQGGNGADTIIGGLGDDNISTVGGGLGETDSAQDIILYDLDSGKAAGADNISNFNIDEDVIRFRTSASSLMGNYYRDQIAIRDNGIGLEIGYGWDESTQDYANTITITIYDDASALADNVIEFVTADGTTALTAAEITAILADIAADGDAPGTLAAIHDDIDAGAGGNDGQLLVDSINAAW